VQRFRDRVDAGRQLGDRLAGEWARDAPPPLVLGLPRGGVTVAAEVARRLGADLDVLVARKIAAPGQPELALGALAEGGEPIWDAALLARVGRRPDDLADVVAAERDELVRRVSAFRGDRPLRVAGRAVLLVDDGVATGATARASLQALRAQGATRLVLAAPVAAPDRVAALAADADDVVALLMPRDFGAVGRWYGDFRQVTDDEVRAVLSSYVA
jgi:putative phosphoribosyl transferase